MIKRLTVLLLFLFATAVKAQVDIDLLMQVWGDESNHDTVRLNALNKVAKEGYLYTQPDSAFYLAKQAYDHAKQTGWYRPLVMALNTQGYSHYLYGEYDEAIPYYSEGLAIADSINYVKGLGVLYNNRALIHMNRGENTLAIDLFSESLKLQEEQGNRFGMAVLLNNIGIIYMDQGDHRSAVENYTRSLKIQEDLGDERIMSNTLNNLGNLFQDQKDYEAARTFYDQSLALAIKAEDELAKANALNNIALILEKENNYDLAKDHYNSALAIYEAIGDQQKVALLQSNIGNIYRFEGKLNKALDLYLASLSISEEIGDIRSASNSSGNLGHVYRDLDKPDIAHDYDVKSLAFAQEAGETRGIRDAAKQLHSNYKSRGNTAKALEMHELFISMRDSIMSEENQRETIRTEFRKDAEKRNAEILLLNAENERKEAETRAERNKRWLTVAIAGFLLLLILVPGLYLHNNRKKEHQLAMGRAELQKNLVENDFLRSRLDPHFVSNALMSINELVNRYDLEGATQYVGRFNSLMRWTLENSSRELVSLDDELEMLGHYVELERPRLEHPIEWSIEVGKGINPEEVDLPPLIMQPLLENALKHGLSRSDGLAIVTVKIELDGNRLRCSIQDNGQQTFDVMNVQNKSHGIRLTKERLALFSKLRQADAKFDLVNDTSGTMASISFLC